MRSALGTPVRGARSVKIVCWRTHSVTPMRSSGVLEMASPSRRSAPDPRTRAWQYDIMTLGIENMSWRSIMQFVRPKRAFRTIRPEACGPWSSWPSTRPAATKSLIPARFACGILPATSPPFAISEASLMPPTLKEDLSEIHKSASTKAESRKDPLTKLLASTISVNTRDS